MKMRRPRTLLGMVLVGLAFVTVPLLIAVGNALVKLGQLAAESQIVLSDSATATTENQRISNLLMNMERNARQYVALKDVASASNLLPLYDGDQTDFEASVGRVAFVTEERRHRGRARATGCAVERRASDVARRPE